MFASLFTRKPSAFEAHSLSALAAISKPSINLVHHQRVFDEDIHLFANTLMANNFNGIDAVITADSVKELIANELDKSAVHTSGKLTLRDDMVSLTHLFLSITQKQQTRLLLKIVCDDACRKFHTDRYDLRLLCTYVGSGTEWIEDRFVNRNSLEGGNNDSIIKDPSKIKTMKPFEVGILKGEASAANKGKGVVHRSPPIQQKNEKRLVFRLDN